MRTLTRLVPILDWLPRTRPADLRGDLIAGLTVAVMIIPQAIAYGLLAGVTPAVALYASLVPMVVYAILGTCRELSVGPAALISLMTAQAIADVAPDATEGGPLWLSLAVLIAVMVGAVQLGLGVARLGVLVNVLSRPVVSGFMSAAALIIGASQLGLLLGVQLPRGSFFEVVAAAILGLPQVHLLTVGLGLACCAILAASRVLAPRVPVAFLLVALTTAATWALGLDAMGLAIVGTVEGGLPVPVLPSVDDVGLLWALAPYALTIALVGFLESISVAKTYGFQHRYDVSANQELGAVGLANLLGGLFGAYVSTGNISRTVVAAQAGARSQLHALVTASVVLLTVLVAAPLFTYLPKATLAAIIIVAVAGIIDVREGIRLFGVKATDAIALLITFALTLFLGVEVGILAGVGASLVLHLYQTTVPHVVVLGRVPGTRHYRSVQRFPQAIVDDELVVLRIDESVYFANAPRIRDVIQHHHNLHGQVPMGMILDFTPVNDLDATAMAVLEQIHAELTAAGTRLCLAGVSGPIHDLLERGGVLEHLGEDNVFLAVDEAVDAFRPALVAARAARPPTEEADGAWRDGPGAGPRIG